MHTQNLFSLKPLILVYLFPLLSCNPMSLNMMADSQDEKARYIVQQGDLIAIIKQGQSNLAEVLIKDGADVNVKDEDGATSLHWAILKNRPDLAELLINNGADVNVKDKDGATPFALFCIKK